MPATNLVRTDIGYNQRNVKIIGTLAGVAFAYFVALPRAAEFLLNFNNDQFNVMVRARDYYSYMGLTLVEKIAARHADGLAAGTVVRAGDFVFAQLGLQCVLDAVHKVTAPSSAVMLKATRRASGACTCAA